MVFSIHTVGINHIQASYCTHFGKLVKLQSCSTVHAVNYEFGETTCMLNDVSNVELVMKMQWHINMKSSILLEKKKTIGKRKG